MSAGHGGRRRTKHEEHEEHENHERWLVSAFDMMTLLFVLFVVLFAMSKVDEEKFAALAKGLAESFGQPVSVMTSPTPDGAVLDGLPGVVDIASAIPPDTTVQQAEIDAAAAAAALERAARVAAEAQTAYDELAAAREQLEAALAEAGYSGAARFEIDERGLVVHIVADAVLFDAEDAALRPEGDAILAAVAPTLTGLPNVLRIEGHANHLPVTRGGPWPSNWELSGWRASTVLRALVGDGVPEDRMSAAGYSSTKPLVPISDPTAISVNRRVDVVVLSTASAEANALLPGIDASQEGTP
ncbi:flagellar motor protein MotB [Blastococcus sp. TML/M2B]|uniref:flagellar motor protein MotB n=1 Tax=unclassified Blastococcus TaxID=2619396 RepID=UPI00190A6D15|nr:MULTISPECIES: flagellar motor protein MotB [unclassified Blastococcus]MBN1091604.1 flagellar motor protein MotB [Blastococcus sp. TML/M2B]MBN1094841.1 flagellar motor protein MotB [Blastococcus sp. TML/C7B]